MEPRGAVRNIMLNYINGLANAILLPACNDGQAPPAVKAERGVQVQVLGPLHGPHTDWGAHGPHRHIGASC